MKRYLSLLFLLLMSVTAVFAADVSGDWKFTALTPNGDPITATWKLKSEGTKVTGTIEADFPGKVTIDEGTVDGDSLKLKLTLKNEDGSAVSYLLTGTVNGAEMKGIVEGEIDGEKIRLNWSAKKS